MPNYNVSRMGMFTPLGGVIPFDWSALTNYFTLDNVTTDSKGSDNGTLVNGATYGTGLINNGVFLDGVNDYFTTPYDSKGLTKLSISFWFKSTTNGVIQFMYRERTSSSINFFRLQIYKSASNIITVDFRPTATGSSASLAGSAITDTDFHHILVTLDTVGDVYKLYVDGVLEDTDNTSLPTIENVTSFSQTRFGINHDGAQPFDGTLDELGIFNDALTLEQAVKLFNSGNGIQYP